MKVKTYWIISGLIILIFAVLLLWPTKKVEENTVKKNLNIFEPTASFSMQSPKYITWNVAEGAIAQSVEALLVEGVITSEDFEEDIRKQVFPSNSSGKETFEFDKNINRFEFSKNITSKDELQRGVLKPEDIRTRFFDTFSKFNEFSPTELSIEEVQNKSYLTPWWVSATSVENTDVYEVLANHTYKGIPIKSFDGFMVKADYFTNGEFAKIEERLPFKKIIKTQDKALKTISELKIIELDQFKIWRVDGGRKYELSDETPRIDRVTVDSYRIEYIYDVKSGVVWPYYVLRGASDLDTGRAKITLIISAVRE